MTDLEKAAAATIAGLLAQVVTMQAETVTITPMADGSLVHILVEGGAHEIFCELDATGSLRSARVIEL